MNFHSKLEHCLKTNNSLLCVGLDPKDYYARSGLFSLINQTKDYVCAYKFNLAFFIDDLDLLSRIRSAIPLHIPVIIDGKFGDIYNTSSYYAKWCFEDMHFDAATINPYMGEDPILAFKQYPGKGLFVLTKTTNISSSYIQDVIDAKTNRWMKISDRAAELASNLKADCVVGGNYERTRHLAPDSWFLCPGIGAQGKELSEPMKALNSDGKGVIISASRSIIESDNPGLAAKELRDKINELRLQKRY